MVKYGKVHKPPSRAQLPFAKLTIPEREGWGKGSGMVLLIQLSPVISVRRSRRTDWLHYSVGQKMMLKVAWVAILITQSMTTFFLAITPLLITRSIAQTWLTMKRRERNPVVKSLNSLGGLHVTLQRCQTVTRDRGRRKRRDSKVERRATGRWCTCTIE